MGANESQRANFLSLFYVASLYQPPEKRVKHQREIGVTHATITDQQSTGNACNALEYQTGAPRASPERLMPARTKKERSRAPFKPAINDAGSA